MQVKELVIKNNHYPCIVFDHYDREDCKRRSDCLFIFGDNWLRAGFGGQAVIRPAKNAIGIITKKTPSHNKSAYYYDKDFTEYCNELDKDLRAAQETFKTGGYKVFGWPLAGIGTGLAKLPVTAPTCFYYLQSCIHVKEYPICKTV